MEKMALSCTKLLQARVVLRRVKPFADLFYGDCTAFYLLIYLAFGLGTVCCTYYLIDCKSAIWDSDKEFGWSDTNATFCVFIVR